MITKSVHPMNWHRGRTKWCHGRERNACLWHFFIFKGDFMAGYDGSIRINTLINEKGFINGFKRLGNSIRGLVGSLGFGLGIAGLVALGKQAIDTASDIQEVQNVVDTAFGSMSYKMEEFAKNSVKQFGISQLSAKQLGSTFMAMGASMLDSAENASDMAINLTARAADMASFYNKSVEETSTALKSIYTGETETLKEYGVVMTQVNLEEFARQQGINKSIQAMTQAEKVQLNYAYVMQQTSLAAGDFARTSDSWANQTRILSEQFKELLSVLGSGLITVLTPVIKFLNTVLSILITIAKQIGEILSKLFGISIPVADSSNLASDLSSAAGGADDLADGMDAAGKSAEKAGKAASKALAPFDKLNVLSQDKGGGSGSGGGAGGAGGGGFEMPELSFDEKEVGIVDSLGSALDGALKRLKELKDLFVQGFFEGLGDYKPKLEELKKDIISIGKALKDIFTDPKVVASANKFADQLSLSLGQVSGSIASIRLTIAQLLIGGIEKYLTQNAGRIKEYIISMFDIGAEIAAIIGDFSVAFADIFSVFGGDTAQQIAGNLIGIFAEVNMMISENAAKLGRDILNMITKPIIDNKDKIKSAIEGTLQAIEPFTSGLLTAVQTVRDAVSDIYDNHLKPLFDSIAKGLSEILGKLLDGYNKYMLPVLQGLGEKFKELMEGPFGDTINKVKDFIGKLIDAVKLFWENVLVPFFSWIADNIMPVLTPIIDFIGNTVLTIFKTIIKVVGDIADLLSGIVDFVVGAFTGDWEKAWDGIGEAFNSVWDAITDVLEGAFDILISFGEDIIGGMLKGIDDAIKGIGDWIKKNIFDPFIKGFKSAFGIHSPSKVMAEQGGFIIDGIRKGITDKWTGFIEFWTEKKNEIINKFKDIKSKFLSRGRDIISGIEDGIKNLWSDFIQDWTEKKNKIVNKFKNIKEEFLKKGNNIISGIKDGIKERWSDFSTYWAEKKKAIIDKFSDIKDKFLTRGREIISGIKSGISEKWSGFISDWSLKKDSIVDEFSGIKDSMTNVGKNIVNGIIDGIKEIWNTLVGWADDIKELFNIKPTASNGAGVSMVGGGTPKAAAHSPAMASFSDMQIPALASGAVIRGGDPFMAVLGDQRRGQTNIETPLPTMVKAFKQVIAESGGTGGDISVRVFLGEKDITKAVKTEADTYFKKTGKNLFLH